MQWIDLCTGIPADDVGTIGRRSSSRVATRVRTATSLRVPSPQRMSKPGTDGKSVLIDVNGTQVSDR